MTKLAKLREDNRWLRDKLEQKERRLNTVCEYASRIAALLQKLQKKGIQ
jgi:hypothetical protein